MAVLLTQLVLVLNGVVAGMLLWSAIGGVPWMMRLPAADYVRLHQFWSPRFDPLAPIMVLLTVAADVTLAVLAPTVASRVLLIVVVGLLLGVAGVSVARNAPLKRRVMALDPARLPDDWSDPRPSWSRWNKVRTVLAVLALLGNVEAMAVLTV